MKSKNWPRTGTLKRLNSLTEMTATVAYDPGGAFVEFEYALDKPQYFEVWFNWFLMSGVGMISQRGPSFRGYLSKFEPAGFAEGETPEAALTIKVDETGLLR